MTTSDVAVTGRVRDLLGEAAGWRLLGRLFECPDDRWHDEVAALAGELQDNEFCAAVAAAGSQATEGHYHSVFGPGGPAPPREASYQDSLELGSLMSDLAAYYNAFSYTPHLIETPDHVAVEVGFVAYLKLKQAYALAAGDDERADVAARAATRFAADHLSLIAAPLAALLADSPFEYLAHASRLLAARVGPRPKSTRLPMLQGVPDEEEGGEFSCAP